MNGLEVGRIIMTTTKLSKTLKEKAEAHNTNTFDLHSSLTQGRGIAKAKN